MSNYNDPAFPLDTAADDFRGLTKLEHAAIQIAGHLYQAVYRGMIEALKNGEATSDHRIENTVGKIPEMAARQARKVLDECAK